MLCLLREKKQKKEEETNFLKNGSLLLEELIASSGGKYNPIRTFSSHQILQATNNFDWNYVKSEDRSIWYKVMIENRQILIKKFQDCSVFDGDNFYRDIEISSTRSSHKNMLKLLGCCLEFPCPVLVCEYPENGALKCIICGKKGIMPLPWNVRLRITKEIANVINYLHTKFPRTIIHRDLKLTNVFLDEKWFVTENVDIYSLRIIKLVLLTGKPEYTSVYLLVLPIYVGKFLERSLLTELIDSLMLDSASYNISQHSRVQMEALIELDLRCVRFRQGENVPGMIEVAKELKRIEKHI